MNRPPPEDPRVRIDALFEQALDLEGAARQAFLAQATAGEPELRAELELLLQLATQPAPHLDAVTGNPLWQALAAEAEPQPPALAGHRRIGAWRLLHELGAGGMGMVYLAERVDGGFQQHGALKLIRTALDSDEFARRFAQERQILATLTHPGIARLLDGGRDADGRPYLVMEYAQGLPLDRYCDEHRLSIEQRLELFLQTAEAVAHAHRHLVVHRDLKPSNILVTGENTVKLLDFGIAKVLAVDAAPMEPVTRTAVRLFTPEYAAPEQVLGQPVATAADVYQLGLLLYELLCGQRAQQVSGSSAAEMERAICHNEPLRPSLRVLADMAALRRSSPAALRRKLRGDLDNIVLKALRKAPERRYATAAELADDIRRWQQGRPVRARPETLGYRTGKFVRRHPFGVTGAATALALLIAYAVTVTVQADTIARERDRARAEAVKAQQVKALVLRLFEGADPQQSGGAQLSARELLDRGWASIETELAGQPEVRVELLDTVGEAYRQLGLYDRAQPLFEQALQLATPLAGSDPLRLAHALRSRARLHTDMGEYPQAEKLLQDALENYQRLLGSPHAEVADTISDMGMLRFRMSDLAAAEREHRDALAMRRQLFDEEHPDVADSLDKLGTVLRHRGDYAAAEPLLSQALALRRRLLPPTHPQLASSLSNLAVTRVNLAEYDSADALYREAQTVMIQASGARHPAVARVMNNHALLMQARRDFSAAEQLLRQALAIRREALGERHPEVAMNLNDLGLALYGSGDIDAAEAHYREALAAYPDDHPWRSATVFNLGELAEKRGDLKAAEQHYREALARQRKDYGEEHERVGIDLNRIGIVLHRQGRLDEAEAYFEQALAIFRKRLPEGHPRLAVVLVPMGNLLLDRSRPSEARALLQEAWQVRHAAFGASDARTVEAAEALAAAGGKLAKQDG
ncbi:serine/threonine-protein kinase [Pseudoxanthomonas wuyuanensis]|uniref:Serine/threonine protein kinase with TPR repeats n=1 Tax=Pseudoxanthomonas wuyuanensis TaxID=1073196 RepID=A0A286CZS8_9GAMM|nr:serine/threonine-protein kinase [Pseudoxanthomonas wuyuanensis]KAF1722390.1 serine/threonine protein kinase [Pseudoxanthomonas wuyuanensis]SOD51887.1 serine/threonine protein kinase with TPR repeats [Pseudoxanthomonas wuyuanensis]